MTPKKILIVDDEPLTIRLIEDLLVEAGHSVIKASDGIDAMVCVKKYRPDLIVLDIMMPEVNGYDVCRYIKVNSVYKDIPILIFTARDKEIDSRIGQMMGIDYLQKPLDRELFLMKVEQLLEQRSL